ncbi:hypothetical protein Hanom_Chr00s001232g01677101 [Helianthus anomalus]
MKKPQIKTQTNPKSLPIDILKTIICSLVSGYFYNLSPPLHHPKSRRHPRYFIIPSSTINCFTQKPCQANRFDQIRK